MVYLFDIQTIHANVYDFGVPLVITQFHEA